MGRAANGNDDVAKLVKEIGGSIGYVEFIYALQNRLSSGKVRNRNGEFVAASLESMTVAASQSINMAEDLKASIVNSPGAGAYPVTSFTWLVVPARVPDDGEANCHLKLSSVDVRTGTIPSCRLWVISPCRRIW